MSKLRWLIALVLIAGAVMAGAFFLQWQEENPPRSAAVDEPQVIDIPLPQDTGQAEPEPVAEQAEEAEPEPPKPQVSANASAHLCYLSFNNPYEVSVARTFAAALARYPEAPKITVSEHQGKGEDPEDAIERLVRSGQRCDGLVLSGHHDEDGEFWGDRTSGDLEIDFLYELFSRPSLSAWSSQVKALWLQGCHTSTTRIFNPEVKDKYRITGSPLGMINRHLKMNDLEGSIDDLNDIFLENTEEDNIILGYARLFPAATIFTWWDQSPGEKSGSHWSLPFHVVQTAWNIDSDPRYFQNPFKNPIPRDAALRYAEILYEAMTRPPYPYKHDGPLQADEKIFITGWRAHGLYAIHKRDYSFENASAIGQTSLLSSHSGVLKQIRGFSILLEQLDEKWVAENPTAVVKAILDDETNIPYNVYLLWAFAQRSAELQAKMRASAELRQHLEWTFNTPGDDSQLKTDYRRFHSFLYASANDSGDDAADDGAEQERADLQHQ